MDVRNFKLINFVYQGGDDCVAFKPRSYGVTVQNATCVGGNGMVIGSLCQYFDINASVENVTLTNVAVSPSTIDNLFAENLSPVLTFPYR